MNQKPTVENPINQNKNWILMQNPKPVLGKIVRHFKAKASKLIHDVELYKFRWQRNYYEHIIRNGIELSRNRKYIVNNPLKWELDKENPINRDEK